MFYNEIKDLSRNNLESLFRKAIENCLNWTWDELDCRKSWFRQPTGETDLDKIFKYLDSKYVFPVCIWREHDKKGEVGFTVDIRETGVSYYLIIYLDTEQFDALLDLYNIEV